MKPMIEYPNLPLLSLDRCFAIFKLAHISTNQVAKLSNFTRMGIYKWRTNKAEPLPYSQERISTLAYKVLRAIKAKTAPFNTNTTIAHITACLNDPKAKPLADCQPEDLLPQSWITTLKDEV